MTVARAGVAPRATLAGLGRARFSTLPAHTVLSMPALSPTMAAGTLAEWVKKEGDPIAPGDALARVETDKATVDYESTDAGFLAKILVPAGTADVTVGRPVAIMVDSADAVAAFAGTTEAQFAGGAAPAAPPAPAPAVAAAAAAVATPSVAAAAPAPAAVAAAPGTKVISSPLARKLAGDAGLAISAVAGTGPGGRIIAADVKEALARGVTLQASASVAAAPAPAAAAATPAASTVVSDARAGFRDIPHTQMRRVIAQRLTASKQSVPHYTLTVDVSLDALLALRTKLNADLPADGKLSLNDFIIKASASALRRVPEANSSWLEHAIRAYDYVDISVAVATPDGLITPIVRDADLKGLSSISGSVKSLVEKARAKKLSPEEYQGGTFTISNLGMFGVRSFSAIINPPQAAILAVGTAERRVVPDSAPDAKSPFKQSVYMTATLSCDHRVVDGAVGAQWLSAFRGFVEAPHTMLL